MIKWEYSFIEMDTVRLDEHSEYLTGLGSEGWEIISMQMVGRTRQVIDTHPDGMPIIGAPIKRQIMSTFILLAKRQVSSDLRIAVGCKVGDGPKVN